MAFFKLSPYFLVSWNIIAEIESKKDKKFRKYFLKLDIQLQKNEKIGLTTSILTRNEAPASLCL